jgi:hypothetical protein
MVNYAPSSRFPENLYIFKEKISMSETGFAVLTTILGLTIWAEIIGFSIATGIIAYRKHRNPIIQVLKTLGWWVIGLLGGSVVGAIFGGVIVAYIGTLVGCLIALSRVNNADTGNFKTADEKKREKLLASAVTLETPGEIIITNESGGRYCYFWHNNIMISGVAAGANIVIPTDKSVNSIAVSLERYSRIYAPLTVNVAEGQTVQVSFVNNHFVLK